MSTLRTPLLRYYTAIYGNLGLNLNTDWRPTCGHLLNHLFNVLLNSMVLYLMLCHDLFAFESMARSLRGSKPLLSLLIRVFIGKLQLLTHFLATLYFLFYGPKVVALLDSPCFRQVYASKSKARLLAVCLVVVNSVHFLIIYFRHLGIFLKEPKTTLSIAKIGSLYVFAFLLYHPLIVMLYQQYAYKQYLGLVEKKLIESGNSEVVESQLLASVRSTALVSQQLNEQLSFTTMVFVVCNIEAVIVIFCFIFLRTSWFIWPFLIYPALTWTYFALILQLNRQVLQTMRQICQRLRLKRRRQWADDGTGSTKEISRFKRISSQELELYLPYFRIVLFSMTQLDLRFIFGAGLFIMSYVTFLMQTNT